LLDELYLRSKINATAYTNSALDFLKSSKQPFFLFIHYWDLHSGYSVPRQFVKHFVTDDRAKLSSVMPFPAVPAWRAAIEKTFWFGKTIGERIGQYDGAINYVDSEIARIVNYLANRGILDDTLFVVTSDHGESLGEHEIYFDHHGLYDVSIHVPLIFSAPQILGSKKVVEGLVSHVDIYPTILDMLGLGDASSNGRSVLDLMNGNNSRGRGAVFFEERHAQRKHGVRTTSLKYIEALTIEGARCRYCLRVHGGSRELYDLSKDKKEEVNLIYSNKIASDGLSTILRDWVGLIEASRQTTRNC
jgi:arylsulfatase A-like enzyme